MKYENTGVVGGRVGHLFIVCLVAKFLNYDVFVFHLLAMRKGWIV